MAKRAEGIPAGIVKTNAHNGIMGTYIPEKQTAVNPMSELNKQLVNAQNRKKELHAIYKKEKKIPIYLSPMYRPWVGNVMRVMINGISIYFKVDGTTQRVPETFANEIVRRRKAIDIQIKKQSKMANVPENNESSPGELSLF